jgi:hypothetical protein
MANFKHQLDWVKDTQIARKTLFLGVSLKMSLDEISV